MDEYIADLENIHKDALDNYKMKLDGITSNNGITLQYIHNYNEFRENYYNYYNTKLNNFNLYIEQSLHKFDQTIDKKLLEINSKLKTLENKSKPLNFQSKPKVSTFTISHFHQQFDQQLLQSNNLMQQKPS